MELALECKLDITAHALEVIHAIAFVESSDHISCDILVADEAYISKQLIEVSFTVSHTVLLIMPVSIKRLLTFGTAKMIHMPLLSKSISDSFIFNRLLACSANRDTNLVMASQAVQLIVSFAAIFVKLLSTFVAIVMPGMHRVPHIHDMFPFINIGVALVTHVPTPLRSLVGIASLT